MQKMPRGFQLAIVAAFTLLMLVVGCAANTDQVTPMRQTVDSQQAAQQPTNQVGVILTMHPEGKKLVADAKGYEERQEAEGNVFALNADGGDPPGQSNITYNYYATLGDVSVSSTGTQHGEQAGSTTGTQTPTASTDQRVDPNVTANVPVGIAAPGGVASPQATGTAGTAGDVNASQQITADLQTVINELKAQNDLLSQLLKSMQGTTEPETGPTG